MSASGDSADRHQELEQLKRDIGSLQQSLLLDSEQRDAKADELEALERKIATLDRRLLENSKALKGVQQEQAVLLVEQQALQGRSKESRVALAGMLRAAYEMGRQPYIRMLLNQVDPARVTRSTTYFQYLAAARTQRLQEMADTVEALRTNGIALQQKEAELGRITTELQRDQEQVAAYQTARAEELAEIKRTIGDKQQQISVLQVREQRVRSLLKQLQQEAETRRRMAEQNAEAARRVAEREAKAAAGLRAAQQQRAEKARAAVAQARAERPALKQQPELGPVLKEESPQAAKQAPAAASSGVAVRPPAAGFGRARGRLPLPVKAPITARFGERKPESGLAWEGVMFAVKEGQEVKAIYPGEVVYSDWLRGYGQLLVVDHGEGYMSLYGHNQLLHKREGEQVTGSELVASAGATGGLERPGLLFEIRHNGEPRDPLQWARK